MVAGLAAEHASGVNWDALELLAELLGSSSSEPGVSAARLTTILGQPDAVESLAECALGGQVITASDLLALLDLLPPLARSKAAGAAFLRGRVAECGGRYDEMQSEISVALLLEPTHGPALRDAAWFALDEGHIREAHTLLVAAAVDEDEPSLRLVSRLLPSGHHACGRNEPCPCGSGRKYKVCCIELNGHDLAARLELLRHKTISFAQRPPQRKELLQVAAAFAGVSDSIEDGDAERLLVSACDPIVVELALFEGRVLHRFVDARGGLLPLDERRTAERWASCRHRVIPVDVMDGRLMLCDSDQRVALDGLWPDDARHALALVDDDPITGPSVLAPPLPLGAADAASIAALIAADASAVRLAAALGPVALDEWRAA